MHKCVRCNAQYESMSSELAKGCSCGSRVFVFVKNAAQEQVDYSWLEDELKEQAGDKAVSVEADAAENIRVVERGAYSLNIKSLLKGDPLVLKSEQGVYYIKLPKARRSEERPGDRVGGRLEGEQDKELEEAGRQDV